MKWDLAVLALVLLAVIGVSRRLSGTPVTPQMLFVVIGVLVGPRVLDVEQLAPSAETVRVLADATLAVVLFADASRIDLRALRREYSVPLRLLGAGLPLTIAAGALCAVAVLGNLTAAEAVVLAIVLAPTDAALGQAVVSDARLPLRVRQGLNVESGLNDGICVPLLFIAIAAADIESSLASSASVARVAAEEIGYGVLAGVVAGLLTGAVVALADRRELIAPAWRQLAPATGAALAYGTAGALGGSGFIGAFVGGVCFGWLLRGDTAEIGRFNEELGDLLNGLTFVVFGAVLLGPALGRLTAPIVLYSVLSLTVVRMVPVALAMAGTRARAPTVAFVGWFGPRGLASIVFALIILDTSHLPHDTTIVTAAYLTVGLSTLVHGVSASPLTSRYAAWLGRNSPRLSRTEVGRAPAIRARGAEHLAPGARPSGSA